MELGIDATLTWSMVLTLSPLFDRDDLGQTWLGRPFYDADLDGDRQISIDELEAVSLSSGGFIGGRAGDVSTLRGLVETRSEYMLSLRDGRCVVP
jgi:hypothetical protein